MLSSCLQVSCGDRDCDGRPCKPNPTTLHPYDFICPEENGYFADPANCMKYYHCSGWVPQRNSCPTGERDMRARLVDQWLRVGKYIC